MSCIPIAWAIAIVVDESHEPIDDSDDWGTGEIVAGIRAYQWGWEYSFPKNLGFGYHIPPTYVPATGNSLKYSAYNSPNAASDKIWKSMRSSNLTGWTSAAAHTILYPTDNLKVLNFIDFNSIGASTIKASYAFRTIQFSTKLNQHELFNTVSDLSLRHTKINNLYLNDLILQDTSTYRINRQSNYTSLKSVLNNTSTCLDNKSVGKVLSYNFGVNSKSGEVTKSSTLTGNLIDYNPKDKLSMIRGVLTSIQETLSVIGGILHREPAEAGSRFSQPRPVPRTRWDHDRYHTDWSYAKYALNMPKYFEQVLTIFQEDNKFVNNNDHLSWIQGCLFLYSLPLSTAHYNVGIQAVIQERREAQEDAAVEAEDAALEAVDERNQQKALARPWQAEYERGLREVEAIVLEVADNRNQQKELVRKWQAEYRRGLQAEMVQNQYFKELAACRAVYMWSKEERLVRKLQSEYCELKRDQLVQTPQEEAAVQAVFMRHRQDELARTLQIRNQRYYTRIEHFVRNEMLGPRDTTIPSQIKRFNLAQNTSDLGTPYILIPRKVIVNAHDFNLRSDGIWEHTPKTKQDVSMNTTQFINSNNA
jgi:hypothetical protein